MSHTTSVVNTNTQSGYQLILPKQNQNPPMITTTAQSICTNLFPQPLPQSTDLQTEDINDSALKKLLETGEITCDRETKTPSSASSDSLPSLDAILNTSSVQSVTTTAGDVEKSSTPTVSETISESVKNTDSNSSELSSAFQKSCRTTEEKCTVCKEGKNVVSCSLCSRSYHADCHVPSLASVKM